MRCPIRPNAPALHQYVLTNGISYRDDSILVNGYLQGVSDTFTVRSPQFFADAYPQTPTVFELEHYGSVKKPGNWEGRPDSAVAKFGKGKTGPDYFRGALELLHATYIGYHGYAHEWLADNPGVHPRNAQPLRLLALSQVPRTAGEAGCGRDRAARADHGEPRRGAALRAPTNCG